MTVAGRRWRSALCAVGAFVAVALASPALAAAETFCVHSPPGCATTHATVADAVSAANINGPEPDRIEVGAGTFNEWFDAGGAIEIIGQGSGQTIFAPPTGQRSSVGTDTILSDMGFRVPSGTGQRALELFDGTVERVAITGAAGASPAIALEVSGTGSPTFRDGSVSITGADSTAIRVGDGTTGFTLEGSQVVSDRTAVEARGTTTVRRATVSGSEGLHSLGAALTIDDVLVRGSGPVAATPFAGRDANVTARHLTIVGDGTGTAINVSASQFGRTATADIRNTIIRDYAIDLQRLTGPDGTANITISYSDWDQSSKNESGNGSTTLGPGNVNDVDPKFLDPGGDDFRLRVDSPLIDIGDPAALAMGPPPEPATDRAGNPRVVDGDGIGGPRRDIGAYEYQPQAPVASASSSPGTVLVGEPVTFDGLGSSDPDPGDSLTYSWSFDDGSTATGAVVQHSFSTPGPHSGTLTVTDSTARSSSATAGVTVNAPVDDPPPGPCANVLSGTTAANSLIGTAAGDSIFGLGGNDRLSGEDGDDCLFGGGGRDNLSGGSGDDSLDGGRGNDTLNGGVGTDTYSGGSGNDVIRASDGLRETINCGSGRDRVTANRSDRLRRCERVKRR